MREKVHFPKSKMSLIVIKFVELLNTWIILPPSSCQITRQIDHSFIQLGRNDHLLPPFSRHVIFFSTNISSSLTFEFVLYNKMAY
jgi:hypothetical protein